MSNAMKIPTQFRKAIDEIKSEVVEQIFIEAEEAQEKLVIFKQNSYQAIEDYMSLLASEYKVTYEGKGGITLTNYEGTLMIVKEMHNFIRFDEKLQIAKLLIDKCINRWSNGSREEIKTLINFAFEVDKQGKVSTERVLGLRKLDIEDEDWKLAMTTITDSLLVTRSKSYIRLYKRVDEYAQWEPLSLNLAVI